MIPYPKFVPQRPERAGTAMESNNGPLLNFLAANSPVVSLDYSLKNFRCG